jgi:hypothetical protein
MKPNGRNTGGSYDPACPAGASTDKMWVHSRSALFSLAGPVILGLLLGMSCVPDCTGYSVLTHEAIIDAAWKDGLEPLLLARFPYATPEELLQAHAFAYGGAIIQDMGYSAAKVTPLEKSFALGITRRERMAGSASVLSTPPYSLLRSYTHCFRG